MGLAIQEPAVPVIDISNLVNNGSGKSRVAAQIGEACRHSGFFYVVNHMVDHGLQSRLEALSREFFSQKLSTKQQISMAYGGPAWRGYFGVGQELTSGSPDLKEGLYFGNELPLDHPAVKAKRPLHGPNLFPAGKPEFRQAVLDYIAAMTSLGHTIMEGIALSLGLEGNYFAEKYTYDPLILFRIFNYPPPAEADLAAWGVGEHTDYGILTILKQDDCGGLEVKTPKGWLPAPPIPNSFVCNIGDMLDRMTAGLYRSTPHRVKNSAGRSRLSLPFFFDPNFDADVRPIPLPEKFSPGGNQEERWDNTSVHTFQGTYGDYLLKKIGKVFPDLGSQVLKL